MKTPILNKLTKQILPVSSKTVHAQEPHTGHFSQNLMLSEGQKVGKTATDQFSAEKHQTHFPSSHGRSENAHEIQVSQSVRLQESNS